MATPSRASSDFEPYWEVAAERVTIEVEDDEFVETHSSILGPDGSPIPYASRKLGFVGYVKLKERR